MVTLQKRNKEVYYDQDNDINEHIYIKNVVLDRKEQNIKCVLVYSKAKKTIDDAVFQVDCEGQLHNWTLDHSIGGAPYTVYYSEFIMCILEENYPYFMLQCVKDNDLD